MDLLLEGARLIDGTGAPAREVSVGVEGGTIAYIGEDRVEAAETVDLGGLVLAPGFLDIHAHSDYPPLQDPRGMSRVHDGVTLEVSGNCGMSPFPLCDAEAHHEAGLYPGLEVDWRDFDQYLDRLRGAGMGLHRAWLVGHGTLRARVMGYDDRPPTPDEQAEMERQLDADLAAGAAGFSTGLIYAPGCYAQPDEVIGLARVVARHDKLYASHIRGEGDTLLEAIDEVLHVGEEAGVRTQVSHLKASKPHNWPKIHEAISKIEAARQRGVDVMADRYPYTATSTALSAVLPGWAMVGGAEAAARRCADPEERGKLLEFLRGRHPVEYWQRVQLATMGGRDAPEVEGKRVAEVAAERGQDPYEVALDLLVESEAGSEAVYHVLDEENLRTVLKTPWVMIGSDGTAVACDGPTARGRPHPRFFGSFARVLGRYARDEKLFSLEEAVAKMTSMPADRLGLTDRGRVTVGSRADLVAFDAETVRDRATFEAPYAYSEGILHVWIDGRRVVAEGAHTGVLAGVPILD